MTSAPAIARKRPVNLTLNEKLVEEAKGYSDNLSATVEALLFQFVQSQQAARKSHLERSASCAAQWNSFHAEVGSFADEHSTL